MNLILSKRIGKLSSLLVYTLLGIPILFVTSHAALSFFGYFPDGVGWDVAEKIVAKKGKVSDCRKIIGFSILPLPGPSIREQRASCIYEYAKLTKDPSACELLMPSSYGLSCVGGAEDFELPCGTEKYMVYWNEEDQPHEASLTQCVRGGSRQSVLGAQCCLVARVRYILNENDCSGVKGNQSIYDRCLYGLAWKNRDPDTCSNISNENAKAGCLVQAKALQKDSSICSGCTKSIADIKDLQ